MNNILKDKEVIIYDTTNTNVYNQFDALTLNRIFNKKKSVAILSIDSKINVKEVIDAVSVEVVLKSEEMLNILDGGDFSVFTNLREEIIEQIKNSKKIFIAITKEYIEFALRTGFRLNLLMSRDTDISILARSCGYETAFVGYEYKEEYIPDKEKYKIKDGFNIFFNMFPILDRDAYRYVMDTQEGKEKYPLLHDLVYHLFMFNNGPRIIPEFNDKYLCYLLVCKYFEPEIFSERAEYHTMINLLSLNTKLLDAFKNMETLMKKLTEFYDTLYISEEDCHVTVELNMGNTIPLSNIAVSNFAKQIPTVAKDMVIDVLVKTDAIYKIFEGNVKYELNTHTKLVTETIDLNTSIDSIEFKIIV